MSGKASSLKRDKRYGMGLCVRTHVQQITIPLILKSSPDIVVNSETGSGETLAYLVPIIHSLASENPCTDRSKGTEALVLVPTRQFAIQVLEVFTQLLRPIPWIIPGLVCGGEKPKSEKSRLRKGLAILIATPGRLLSFN